MTIESTTMSVASNGKTIRVSIKRPHDDEDIVFFLARVDAMQFADCLYDLIAKMPAQPKGKKK